MNFFGSGVETALLEYMAEPKRQEKPDGVKAGAPRNSHRRLHFSPTTT